MTQKIQFPMPYMKITQGTGVGTHKGTYALDCAGSDGGIDFAVAPFTGVIKKKYANGNTVWLESSAPVEFADGTVDYATCSFTHDNNISNLTVGQTVAQGARFYEEGVAGYATGNHIHLEIGRGKFSGTGWFKNAHGIWTINNMYLPYNAFFVDGITILNGGGYTWKTSKKLASIAEVQQAYRDILEREADQGGIDTYTKKTIEFTRSDLLSSKERQTLLANKQAAVVKANALALAKAESEAKAKAKAELAELARIEAELKAKAAEEALKTTKDAEQDKRLATIETLLKVIVDFLSKLFNGFNKQG